MDGTSTFALITAMVCVPGIVFSSRSSVLTMSFVALAAAAMFQVLFLELPGEYWAHVLPGAVLGRSAMQALRGDGGPLQVVWWQGALASGGFLLLVFLEMYTTHLTRLGHLSHIMIYVASGSIAAGAALGSMLGGESSGRRARTVEVSMAEAPPLSWLTAARVHHDSACLFGIGLVLRAHKHDPQEIAVQFHSTQVHPSRGMPPTKRADMHVTCHAVRLPPRPPPLPRGIGRAYHDMAWHSTAEQSNMPWHLRRRRRS